MKYKQVIIVRSGLNMSIGKTAVQVAHASQGAFLSMFRKTYSCYHIDDKSDMKKVECKMDINTRDYLLLEWLEGKSPKVVVKVNSEKELLELYNKIKEETSLPSFLVTDSGLTEFNNIPTSTCFAVGPALDSDIDKYTGDLELM